MDTDATDEALAAPIECSHEPEWTSVQLQSSGHDGVVDVYCKHCGVSGSILLDPKDILW